MDDKVKKENEVKNQVEENKLENVSGGWVWENRGKRKQILDAAGIEVERNFIGSDKYYKTENGVKKEISKEFADAVVKVTEGTETIMKEVQKDMDKDKK